MGGRGKAGGIKFANTPKKAFEISKELLNSKLNGEQVNFLLVEEKVKMADLTIRCPF